jgi:MoaA/NifB/PqqE/SkfB family radical SAM enzyme
LNLILKYAYNKKINLSINSGANLNSVKEELLESVVKYKLKALNISLDGATSDTYRIYRREGDFNQVIKNIRIINFFKKKYHSEFPRLIWQFIIFGHNEHEIPKARKMANKLGMTFFIKLNKDSSYSPIKDIDFVKKESRLNVASRYEFYQKYKRQYLPNCRQFWTSPKINWDGKFLGCCDNIWYDFGNVFKQGLKQCLKNEQLIYTKQVLLGKKKAKYDTPCLNCQKFKFIQNNPLKKKDIILNPILL